ncbi:hypothetical protein T4B_4539 [Trichinella pseudospiralis]|uniref:Uncharacterized protein n=1 Tax=Trichinella pseudospiralis TaxID=6337 RepID=A0A0V1J973_TRIPS|nr:hypothetical protein T4E_4119 [Trichinella pseudospiralis]KRY79961.1 hypothetical protein T4A_1450 [Trichinella pseudospiralis]KRZ31538.1 hypothetical protein T4B_4539 [Trichinella pseudospiralis]KRZ43068.1 hypothetical protein T4C_1570 [Trichinella pseudospiralis]
MIRIISCPSNSVVYRFNKGYLPRRIWALGREQILPTLPGLNSILSDTSWSGFHLCKPFNTDMLTTA